MVVMPGDELALDQGKPVVLGPGVYCDPQTQTVIPVNAGVPVVKESAKRQTVYVEYNSKRYIPSVGDLVIGVITSTFSDSYRVSLSSFSNSVSLSYMAFPNASKKNRPTLKVGDLVYARVSSAEKELEAEIECLDSTTGESAGFGLLEGGMVIDVTLAFARRLLFNDDFPLLLLLSKRTQFEVAIGVNGKVWIKCDEVKYTMACFRSIMKCQDQPVSQYKDIIKQEFDSLPKEED
ncbi:Exosome complex component RRP40 [Nakaseomyces glabratus]|uniref:Exosome complex component RRP40 n=1 Tax=Candida glabrata TaxID=5478 RepID=A0A0W0ERN9_CANGB|nr:Exosome complex exonuclease Rrp40 N-terminal domain [Nakaseomyces glabratus]KAH7598185.1 Exosome complex exonuclease Rrp40 N-terminal domain [Nakaseomyces glabratus]KTB03875.1 Exosome complex component RRP40 [Nakaseomyces glabratus]KTB05583.1 Exosome complex component RRP40 [Nakaseomyces glabratus]KTB10381.1 Exosome complex component RRP40 [Nakaseomyces glabratus]